MIVKNQATYLIPVLYLILGTMLFDKTIANEADVGGGAPIPTELQVLMAGWEDNFSQAHTVQAHAQLRVEDVSFKECKDLDNKSYQDQNVKMVIWKDGNIFHTDIVYDRTFDTRKNKVTYHLPYGEHIMPVKDLVENREDLYRKHGVVQTTIRFLQLKDKQYNYFVESKDFTIDKVTPSFFPGPQACEWILKGSILGSQTFPEYIRRKAKLPSTKSFEVKDLGNGRHAIYQNFIGTKNETKFSGKTRLVINATKGYTIENFTRNAENQIIYDAKYEYAEIGKVWVLVSADFKRYDWMGDVNKVNRAISLSVDVNSLKINEPVDPNVFTVQSLNIQKGTLVRDSISDKRYLFNDIPIHLKAALAETQNYIIYQSIEDLEGVTDKKDNLPSAIHNSSPVVSKVQTVQQDDIRDTSHRIQSNTGTTRLWTVIVSILIGVAIIAILFYRKLKLGKIKK